MLGAAPFVPTDARRVVVLFLRPPAPLFGKDFILYAYTLDNIVYLHNHDGRSWKSYRLCETRPHVPPRDAALSSIQLVEPLVYLHLTCAL